MENNLLYRYIRGTTTPDEDLQVALWLEADPSAHQKELDSVRFLFESMEMHGDTLLGRRRMRVAWSRYSRYAVRVAAAVLIAVGAGYMTYQQTFRSFSERMNSVRVPAGQRMELTLADGTQVMLNSEAEIEYPAVFARNTRRVRLTGEAMFRVRHDAKHPFVVQTFASDVQVLGTKFNVDADPAANRFSTTLLEGSVLVSNRLDPSQPDILMHPDQVVSLVDGRLRTEALADDTSLCWTEGLLYVTGLTFQELMDKFEQVFGVRVVIDRPNLPDMGAVGGKIRVNAGIGNALRILQYAADFTYEIDDANNTVIIR